ncbi:MAG TPA: carbohydrate-binding protein, partial [Burkholderiaceae bacterium]|nr:carbohydrate-binding protein [Burkholderiaceae bacterium]
EAHHYIGLQASTGYDISPAAEWLLDNFHLIEAQLKQIHEGLPRSYFRALPMLLDEPLAGLPRVYGIAWAFVAHTDGAFDEALLIQFLNAYQETRELNLSEAWALPTTLRVVLIENLRRLAERVACNKAAREAANLCCDRIDECTVEDLDALLAELDLRGVGRVFLAQMAQRRRDGRHTAIGRHADHHDEWLQQALPDLAAAQAQQITDQASDNLSVSNAVGSLRAIGDADWSDIVARSGALMRLMLGSPVFKAEHATTRDQTLHGIERLAKRSGRSELSVGHTLLDLLHAADPDDAAAAVTSHWLSGAGRPALLRALGMQERAALFGRGAMRHLALPLYLGSLLLGTLLVVAWLLSHHSAGLTGALREWWWALPVALVSLFPASEAVVAVINRLISESMRPRHLPRLALADGIPPEHRVMVVIPAMLTDRVSTQQLVHRLQLHHLANPERHAQFALLSDWADADSATTDSDDTLLADAVAQVHALNVRHRDAGTASEPRFIVLHRARRFSPSEQRWIGWERKRGKLEQLIGALVESTSAPFIDLGDASRIAADTRYIVTLDSDTQLPPGCLRALVGVAAHPQNQPVLDATARRVVAGYGILQPRILTPLPTPRSFTLYHWLFAGRCGIDPYSAATSEIYQDLFAEGSYSGKGLLHVGAMHAVLAGRLPEGQVLSHDLLEGSIARCAAVTDITVIEDAPFHADVAASRVHRWTRGDWQLLPMLRLPLRAVNRWKMFDNLRRSLVAPMSLALLLLAVAGSAWSPWVALVVVLAAFTGGPLMGAVAALVPGRSDLAKLHFFRQAGIDLARALWGGLWSLAQLTQLASMALDAIGRAIWRMTVSHRHLLQWTTAAAAQAHAQTTLAGLLQRHRAQPVLALALLAVLFAAGTAHPVWAVVLCTLWAAAPLSTWWVSRVRPVRADAALPLHDQAYMHGIARDTWRLFERCVGTQDNHLPPDNLQTAPHDMVAHRTSPTNIGLYLLSVACARQFGWIGTQELLARLEATLGTLGTLQTHRGHFLNWYDTLTRAPLLPMYVSTVDSGNLSGHLLAVAQACRALASAPHDDAASRRAIQLSTQRLRALRAHASDRVPAHGAMSRLLALADPLSAGRDDAGAFEQLLREADDELRAHGTADRTATTPAGTGDPLRWCLSDHVAMLRSAGQDARAAAACELSTRDALDAPALRLLEVARTCEQLAWQPEFGFLYHRKRHLFHIGYRVAEQELDAGFYDLLASESRLTSLLAIAKGDVPV